MKRFHLPFTSRMVLATLSMLLLVIELAMLAPDDRREVQRALWVQKQLGLIEQDVGLSAQSRRKLQVILEQLRADSERTPWKKLTHVAIFSSVMTLVILAVVWRSVIQPARRIFEEQALLAKKREQQRRRTGAGKRYPEGARWRV